MFDNRKAPSGVGALDRAGAEKAAGNSSISISNSNMSASRRQGFISSLLNVGESNAIKSADLVRLAGLKDTRQLRDAISTERADGELILSTCRPPFGYFLPSPGEEGRREIESFIKTVHARACNSQLALRTARRALKECYGQEYIEDESNV